MFYDVIIIGKGPAGITASIYLKRANLECLVIGKDGGALEKTKKVENYYGFEQAISGKELLLKGIQQAQNLNIPVISDEVINIEWNERFKVTTRNQQYESNYVILATGTNRNKPNIKGIKEYEGKGVSYCAVCDAFFYREKDVSVIGNGIYAVNELEHLKKVAKSVTLLTNGEPLEENVQAEVIQKPIKEVRGEEVIKSITFEDNTNINTSGIFIAQGMASSSALAKKLGAIENDGKIIVNEKMKTNIPNLYAIGDCTGPIYQITKAVYQGTIAAIDIAKINKEVK